MSINIAQLEKAWLQAETMADAAKRDAMRANDQQAKVRQADAERKASAAFDLLWQAKGHQSGQGQQSIHA